MNKYHKVSSNLTNLSVVHMMKAAFILLLPLSSRNMIISKTYMPQMLFCLHQLMPKCYFCYINILFYLFLSMAFSVFFFYCIIFYGFIELQINPRADSPDFLDFLLNSS